MRSRPLKYWREYSGAPPVQLPDPRTAIARWIEWDHMKIPGLTNKTIWSFPEPDNMNRSIWHERAHDIPGLKNQMWYRDRARGGWFSVYYSAGDADDQLIEDYIKQTPVWAYWVYTKNALPRTRATRIELESKRWNGKLTRDQHTSDERLYIQGFMEGLEARGVSKEFIERFAGIPRDIVVNQLEEVEDLD